MAARPERGASRRRWATAEARSGSAQTAPGASNTARGSRAGTSLAGTSAALVSSMKSRLPDQAVAITGRPSSIASAGISPKPSLRCRDSTMSAASVIAWASAAGSVRVSSRMLSAPATAARNVAKSAGKSAGLPTFSTSSRSARPAKAARKAATAPSGFLRSNDEARLNDTSVTTASAGQPNAARSSRAATGGATASGGVTTRTRPGSSGSSASAVKCDRTQAWCTNGTPTRQPGGATGSSHAQ